MSAQSEDGRTLNFHRVLAAALLSLAALLGGDARADWVSGAKSSARLIDGGAIDGARYAGLQLRLTGSAVTYWRDPGEAGTPPVFDFTGSANVAEAKILYPQPSKIMESGLQAFGYQHDVLFPIRVTPADRDRPAVLALAVDYAVCEAICLPNRATLRLVLPPRSEDAEGAALVAGALKEAPKSLDAAQAKSLVALAAAAPADGKAQWRLKILSPGRREVFVESPRGFYVETRPGADGDWLLTLAEHPQAQALPDAPLRVTLSGPEPVEFDLALPAAHP